MASNQAQDKFAQLALISVTESAANTLTFKKLETGIPVTSRVAWIINKIEYTISSLVASIFGANTDSLSFGFGVNNGIAAPTLLEETIFDFNTIQRADLGTAASGFFTVQPINKDFSTLPSGGILVPPNPLYLFAKGSALEAATTVYARLWYSVLEMAPQDYLELVQARQVIES